MKISISKSLTCLALFCSVLYLQGCGDSNVRAVKNGVLNAHPDAQIGPVFKANFSDISWKSSKENGKNCVRFTGKISKATHEKMAKLLDAKNPNSDFVLLQLFPDLYKDANEKLDKQFKGKTDALKAQYGELDDLIAKLKDQKSKLEDENQSTGNRAKIEEIGKKIAIAQNDTWTTLHNKSENLRERENKERMKMHEAIRTEMIGKYFWAEGDPVEIEFVVHPEGNLEVKEMKCESWSKFGLTLADVLNGIYQ